MAQTPSLDLVQPAISVLRVRLVLLKRDAQKELTEVRLEVKMLPLVPHALLDSTVINLAQSLSKSVLKAFIVRWEQLILNLVLLVPLVTMNN